MLTKNKRLFVILSSAALLLLVPFTAMQFTGEVKWSLLDFMIGAVLLFGTGLLLEVVLRKVKKAGYRVLLSFALFLVLFLVWAEMAVGIFGSPIAGS